MHNYRIITDSSCDLSPEILSEWGADCVDLKFWKRGEAAVYANRDLPAADFYQAMRAGDEFQTSTVNPYEYKRIFRGILDRGDDILYLGFSSGLSATCHAANTAAAELAAAYPQQKIRIFDTRCASAGQGLLLYYAVREQHAGASLDEVFASVSEIAPKICHWFTVDDLRYLRRGGRISGVEAFAATILNIKPILHMDDAGQLKAVSKVRGRKQAIKALYEKYRQLAEDPESGLYSISHADCPDDARLLEEMICQQYGHRAAFITDIGSVIGAHSGPGTLALFFTGRRR